MTMNVETYHIPALLQESIDGLDIQPDGIYVDVTFGGGGHSAVWAAMAICTASTRMPMPKETSLPMIDSRSSGVTLDI